MEFVIIFIITLALLIITFLIFGVNTKKLKAMENIKELDDIAEQYPSNIDICKEYLKKVNNNKVKIEEDKNSGATLYIAISDKILIGDMKNSYARIQTIAHECLHTIQKRSILLFNFILSNIYLIYFAIILILGICAVLPSKMTFLTILCIMGIVYYSIKMYLENDAMIKARYLAKEYMEEKQISKKEEIEKLVKQFDMINNLGIRVVQYQVLSSILIKIAILALIFAIR